MLIMMMAYVYMNLQYRQDFSNQLAIITKEGDTGAIRLDGQPLTSWSMAWGYGYAAFPVSHGAHYITVTPGSSARFTAYAYGHSLITTSSSAYGFTAAYKGKGTPIFRPTCFDYCSFRYAAYIHRGVGRFLLAGGAVEGVCDLRSQQGPGTKSATSLTHIPV